MDACYAPIVTHKKKSHKKKKYTDNDWLGHLCDAYYDPRDCEDGGGRTVFNVKLGSIDHKAELCLESFNRINNKKFTLEKVVKVNLVPFATYCMTFTARDIDSNEYRYFRGLVDDDEDNFEPVLCLIKEDGDKGLDVPPGHDEADYRAYEGPNGWYSGSDTDDGLEDDSSARC